MSTSGEYNRPKSLNESTHKFKFELLQFVPRSPNLNPIFQISILFSWSPDFHPVFQIPSSSIQFSRFLDVHPILQISKTVSFFPDLEFLHPIFQIPTSPSSFPVLQNSIHFSWTPVPLSSFPDLHFLLPLFQIRWNFSDGSVIFHILLIRFCFCLFLSVCRGWGCSGLSFLATYWYLCSFFLSFNISWVSGNNIEI